MFKGDIDGVTVEMLDSMTHTPAIIIRKLQWPFYILYLMT
jgi:F420-0:gamma-glutamyl ligase-like protein